MVSEIGKGGLEYGFVISTLSSGSQPGKCTVEATCRYVLGTEIDPLAVETARENVELNGFSGNVKVLEADLLHGVPYKADVVVANLMHDLVIRLAPDAFAHLDAGGIFISSGILVEKRDQVAAAVEAAGFEILEIPEDGEWCAIAARKV